MTVVTLTTSEGPGVARQDEPSSLGYNDKSTIGQLSAFHHPSLLPGGAFDTHVHVFDSALGPYHPSRAYTPHEAPLIDLLRFTSLLGTGKTSVVLVQPSPYRSDNTVMLAALAEIQRQGSSLARGIAVVDCNSISVDELWNMHHLGVRGIRLNLESDGGKTNIEALRKELWAAARIVSSLPSWKIQLFCAAHVWDEIHDDVLKLPVKIIADHIGGLKGNSKLPPNETSTNQHGMESLIDLAQQGRVYIKLSGLYRASNRQTDTYSDLKMLIWKLVRCVPDQLIWGSDWPHTGDGSNRGRRNDGACMTIRESFQIIDDRAILQQLRKWIPCDDSWRKLMIENPARVFDTPVDRNTACNWPTRNGTI